MSDCKTFHGVTQAIFDRIKESSGQEYGTVYDPPNAVKGTATTHAFVGKVILSFDFDVNNASIQYCIDAKPWIAPVSAIFSGISDMINKCRKQ